MAKRKYTTKTQDREFLAKLMADMGRAWKVGDTVSAFGAYDATTTITKIEGTSVEMADGKSCHISRLRSPEKR